MGVGGVVAVASAVAVGGAASVALWVGGCPRMVAATAASTVALTSGVGSALQPARKEKSSHPDRKIADHRYPPWSMVDTQ